MSKSTGVGVFIFRRDFRLQDNLGLAELSKACESIVPIFIFDPFQIYSQNHNKHYFSNKSVKFMIESLEDLNKQLNGKLQFYHGQPHAVIKDIISKNDDVTCIGFNKDFSPYSKIRDQALQHVCEEMNIRCIVNEEDLLLHPIDKILSGSGDALTVFGSYYKRAQKINVANPIKSLPHFKFTKQTLRSSMKNTKKLDSYYKLEKNDEIQEAGTSNGKQILDSLEKFDTYHEDRDLLNYETTRLSTHLKFGTISLRETYHAVKKNLGNTSSGKALIRQLYWRMFYFILANHRINSTLPNESIIPGYGHIEKRFKQLPWIRGNTEERLGTALWEKGETGYPMIDACIRQLNKIGWMHNRGRLMVASFAVNILHIDPFSGRRWSCQEAFSSKLIDCCYANNYGNWMWILGPYDPGGYRYGQKGTFGGRVFKDIISFKEYDPQLKFIRKWIPELDDVPDEDVFKWHDKGYLKHKKSKYPKPIVDFEKNLKKWYEMTKK